MKIILNPRMDYLDVYLIFEAEARRGCHCTNPSS